MEADTWPAVEEEFAPTEDDDHSVVVIQYDEYKAPSDNDYVTAPYTYDSLEGIPLPPEKPDISYVIYTEDNERYVVSDLREDPPDWVDEFEKE